MTFAIKTVVSDPLAQTFAFSTQKTMYCGKQIAKGDTIFLFASENERWRGLMASGVTSAKAIAKKRGIGRQALRVIITIKRTELKRFCDWNDGRPESELNFKFYRQATNKIIGISDGAAAFLRGFF
jgi:hypothetical protein